MINPELRLGRTTIKISVAGIVEQDGDLFLVQEADGYGPPAGNLEDYETFYPQLGLSAELHEETDLDPTSIKVNLWGALIFLSREKISLGLVYRINKFRRFKGSPITDPNVLGGDFFDKGEVRQLLRDRQIRKSKWNDPILSAWLAQRKFLLYIGRSKS